MCDDPTVPQTRKFRLLAVLNRVPVFRYVLLHRLKGSGWRRSRRRNEPVDVAGDPLAWYAYSALQFLESRIRADVKVSIPDGGNSTLWSAQRAGHLSSVESDVARIAQLKPRLPDSVDLAHEEASIDGTYARSVQPRSRPFDVAVIDGHDRNNCARQCLAALKPNGIMHWDNADWVELFADGFAILESQGFSRVDFAGISALNGYGSTTAVFYPSRANCLRLRIRTAAT